MNKFKNMPTEDKLLFFAEALCYMLSYIAILIFILIMDKTSIAGNTLLIVSSLILLYTGVDARKSRDYKLVRNTK